MGMIATLFFFHEKGKSYLHWHKVQLGGCRPTCGKAVTMARWN
jgi:hypothetical protein